MSLQQDDVPTILKRILETKLDEVRKKKNHKPLSILEDQARSQPSVRGFHRALQLRVERKQAAVIAEVKKASPSKGIIRDPFDPVAIATAYEKAGAACLSVLTDEPYFKGSDKYLVAARNAVDIPVLRKDFMIDPYQIVESRALGADCVLLIVAALADSQLQELWGVAKSLGLDVLVEVHTVEELDRASLLGPELLGINNRDLHSFNTDLGTTIRLQEHCRGLQLLDGHVLVTESGIHTPQDVDQMLGEGVYAFLVGEAFMREEDPGAAMLELFGSLHDLRD